MSDRRRAQLPPPFDFDGTLHVLRDNMGRADAMITAAERLIEEPPSIDEDEDEDESIARRRNHIEHLIETAKLAVRGAIYAGRELERHSRGA